MTIPLSYLYLLTKADYDWNEPMGIFPTADEARAAIALVHAVEWLGEEAEGVEYPTIDCAMVPNERYGGYLIREMVIGMINIDRWKEQSARRTNEGTEDKEENENDE